MDEHDDEDNTIWWEELGGSHPNEGEAKQGSLLMIVCHDVEGDEDDDEVNGGDDHHDHGDDNDERS